jgi:hypothetical protein
LLRLLSEPHSDAELLFCGSRALLLCLLSIRHTLMFFAYNRKLSVSKSPPLSGLAQRDGEVAGDSMALGSPIASRRSDRRV